MTDRQRLVIDEMPLRVDLGLYDGKGQLVAVVEVKNLRDTSGEWAARTRRNMLAHGLVGRWDFFLMVTPDRLYVWKDVGNEPVELPPTYEADCAPTFAPYFERAGIDPANVTGPAFEMLVSGWFSDLTWRRPEQAAAGQEWLDESGFRAAVVDGHVEHEVAL